MLTNISGTNSMAGYQAQLATPKTNLSDVLIKPDQIKTEQNESAEAPVRETDDTVDISREAKSLENVYQKRKSDLEQNHNAEREQLEREYLQEKNELKREFEQKKHSLAINTYA